MASLVTACDTLSAKAVAGVVGPAGVGGGSDACGRISRPHPASTMTAAIDSAAILKSVLWPIGHHVSPSRRRRGRTAAQQPGLRPPAYRRRSGATVRAATATADRSGLSTG